MMPKSLLRGITLFLIACLLRDSLYAAGGLRPKTVLRTPPALRQFFDTEAFALAAAGFRNSAERVRVKVIQSLHQGHGAMVSPVTRDYHKRIPGMPLVKDWISNELRIDSFLKALFAGILSPDFSYTQVSTKDPAWQRGHATLRTLMEDDRLARLFANLAEGRLLGAGRKRAPRLYRVDRNPDPDMPVRYSVRAHASDQGIYLFRERHELGDLDGEAALWIHEVLAFAGFDDETATLFEGLAQMALQNRPGHIHEWLDDLWLAEFIQRETSQISLTSTPRQLYDQALKLLPRLVDPRGHRVVRALLSFKSFGETLANDSVETAVAVVADTAQAARDQAGEAFDHDGWQGFSVLSGDVSYFHSLTGKSPGPWLHQNFKFPPALNDLLHPSLLKALYVRDALATRDSSPLRWTLQHLPGLLAAARHFHEAEGKNSILVRVDRWYVTVYVQEKDTMAVSVDFAVPSSLGRCQVMQTTDFTLRSARDYAASLSNSAEAFDERRTNYVGDPFGTSLPGRALSFNDPVEEWLSPPLIETLSQAGFGHLRMREMIRDVQATASSEATAMLLWSQIQQSVFRLIANRRLIIGLNSIEARNLLAALREWDWTQSTHDHPEQIQISLGTTAEESTKWMHRFARKNPPSNLNREGDVIFHSPRQEPNLRDDSEFHLFWGEPDEERTFAVYREEDTIRLALQEHVVDLASSFNPATFLSFFTYEQFKKMEFLTGKDLKPFFLSIYRSLLEFSIHEKVLMEEIVSRLFAVDFDFEIRSLGDHAETYLWNGYDIYGKSMKKVTVIVPWFFFAGVYNPFDDLFLDYVAMSEVIGHLFNPQMRDLTPDFRGVEPLTFQRLIRRFGLETIHAAVGPQAVLDPFLWEIQIICNTLLQDHPELKEGKGSMQEEELAALRSRQASYFDPEHQTVYHQRFWTKVHEVMESAAMIFTNGGLIDRKRNPMNPVRRAMTQAHEAA